MKQIFHFILTGVTLAVVMAACSQKNEIPKANTDVVDLRYRVESEYHLDATSAKPFNIVVKSSRPWTITSDHPDWCIIEKEEGEAVADTLVHKGQGESTTVKVQYYNNTDLDDRVDKIKIESDGYLGKTVTVYQSGIAYLNVPEADIEGGIFVLKPASEFEVHVRTNQKWSAKILPEGDGQTDWLSIAEGETGELDGTVKVSVKENPGEKRYANIAIYDRHDEERAMIKITQDGVQLDPETFEIRAGYDQLAVSLSVVSNASWTAEKQSEEDTWYTIDNPSGHNGDGVINVTLTDNSAGTALRRGAIVLSTVPAEGAEPLSKTIVLKQAYPITPVRKEMDSDEMGAWESDWANPPTYTKDYGTLFTAKARLHNGSMPFGNYTFRWKDITADPAAAEGVRVRHWFCFDEGCELKFDIRPVDGKISFDFNAAGDGNKPSVSSYTAVDFSKPVEITYKFDPSGAEHCHVTYLVNGNVAGSFDTSADMLRSVKWGSKINMYVGVDKSGSGVMEWYEYTAPMDWGD